MTVRVHSQGSITGLWQKAIHRDAWLLAVLIAVLPNLLCLVTLPFLVATRPLSPGFYFLAGLLSLRLPARATYILFLLAAALDFAFVVSVAFHLPFGMAIQSVRYLATIDAGASKFYVLVVLAFALNGLLSAWLLLRFRATVGQASLLPATLLMFVIPMVDWYANRPHMLRTAEHFESAVMKTGLTADTIAAGGRNLLVVMVEGMGAFADPVQRHLLGTRLAAVTAGGRYQLSTGTSSFQGSTTAAESRELCGRWGDFVDYVDGSHPDCLPQQLATRGYETVSYHGFSHTMFSRRDWYPNVGFAESHFLEDLGDTSARRCGTVFAGMCDGDVARVVGERLTSGSNAPKLVYWLTLNSHIPHAPLAHHPLGCGGATAAIANRQVCELTEIWGDVFSSVAAIAENPDLPPTDILLVGDHGTPLWERDAAAHFLPGKVDWYLLSASGR